MQGFLKLWHRNLMHILGGLGCCAVFKYTGCISAIQRTKPPVCALLNGVNHVVAQDLMQKLGV